jgi:hypothetical protein
VFCSEPSKLGGRAVLRALDRPPAWGSAPAPDAPSAKHRWRLQCRSQPPLPSQPTQDARKLSALLFAAHVETLKRKGANTMKPSTATSSETELAPQQFLSVQ